LKKLSLKDLGEVQFYNPEASSAARKTQKLLDTPAALFVISQEDIRRAGITNIAEALRLAPGVQVAHTDANTWAISARGLNGLASSKLLVMIDGRTVYTPISAQVSWRLQDILIEDIERIEVIRGPGASLWGANAVNGIINIITKAPQQTQGDLVTTYLGTGEEQAILGVRHSGKMKKGHYRVYGKVYKHDNFVDALGIDQQDNWLMKRGGFRADINLTERDNLTVQGDIYDGFNKRNFFFSRNEPPITNYHTFVRGLNLLSRWKHNLTNGDFILQSYYDWFENDQTMLYKEKLGTYDLDFQHRWQVNDRQEFIWGLGFRYVHDDFEKHSTSFISFAPKKREYKTLSGFVQAEFILQPEVWKLIVGSKFEHNDYVGFEYQPSTRLLWSPHDKHSLWAAVSRAVRTPSRYDEDSEVRLQIGDFGMNALGNRDFQSEVLTAYELGYRLTPTNHFFLDLSLFYNDYDKLRTIEPIGFQPPSTLITTYGNKMTGEVYGLEMAAQWQVSNDWRLMASYTYTDVQLHQLPTSQSVFGEVEEGDTPHHQATLRSLLNLPHNIEFDTALYYVDNVPNQHTPNYTRFDVRLGWQAQKDFNLSLGARNLFDSQHPEFGSGLEGNVEIPDEVRRAFYIQMNYRF
jgi:iron complex outermembrane receptor protein